MAACLYAGPDALAAGLSAAGLWGLDGFGPGPIEVLSRRRLRARGIRYFRTRTLRPADTTTRNGIPVTTVARTLLDLAGRIPAQRLEIALDSALSQGLISLPAMWRFLNRTETRGRKGVRTLRMLLADRAGLSRHAQNGFETKLYGLLRTVCPDFVKQFPVMDGEELVAQLDFALPRLKLGLEGQSMRWHSSKAARHRDARKLNRLLRLGWRVLYFYWEDVAFDPEYVIAEVKAMIESLTLAR
ncbi:MAG: endonuclease domain-containing protein [Actinomycetota bacterium]